MKEIDYLDFRKGRTFRTLRKVRRLPKGIFLYGTEVVPTIAASAFSIFTVILVLAILLALGVGTYNVFF